MGLRAADLEFAVIEKAFADDGTGTGNLTTAGTDFTVTHALGYTPNKEAIISVLCQADGATTNDVAQAFAVVSAAATTFTIRPSRTIANTATPGLNSFTVRLLVAARSTLMRPLLVG